MSAKILIYGEPNTGKTSLLATLRNAFIISRDGKQFPFAMPHTNIGNWGNTAVPIEDFIGKIHEKLQMYKTKEGVLPETVVLDSISTVIFELSDICSNTYTNWDIYTEITKQVNTLTKYFEELHYNNNMNLVILSHIAWDGKLGVYEESVKGSVKKWGGTLATTDYSVRLEVVDGKRTAHVRDTAFARWLPKGGVKSMPIDDFNLQEQIDTINAVSVNVKEFSYD